MDRLSSFSKIFLIFVWLMLGVGSAFGDEDCLETATVWKDCVSEPLGDTTINDVTYKKITTEKELAWFSNFVNSLHNVGPRK